MSRQLATVLTLRRRAEDEAIRSLATAEAMARAAHLEVTSATADLRRPVEGDDTLTFTVSHDLSARRGDRQKRAVEQAKVADTITDTARTAYLAAHQQTEMISKLIEKKAAEAMQNALVTEQKQLDEASASMLARGRA